MKLNIIKILILFLFFVTLAFSQENTEKQTNLDKKKLEEVEKLIIQVKKLREKDPQKSIDLAREALKLATALNSYDNIAESYNNIGIAYDESKNLDSALHYFSLSIENWQKINDIVGIAKVYNNIGVAFYNSYKYEQAIEYYKKSLDLRLKTKDIEEIKKSYNNIAYLYKVIKDYENSLIYYFELQGFNEESKDLKSMSKNYNHIAQIYREIDELENAKFYYYRTLELNLAIMDTVGMIRSYSNLGFVYYELQKYDSSIINHNFALKLSDYNERNDIKAAILNNIALVYKTQGKYDKAIEYSKNAYELNNEIGSENNFFPLTTLAEIMIKTKKYREALKYLTEAEKSVGEGDDLTNQRSLFKLYSDYYLNTNDFRNSLKYYKLFSDIRDSMNREENRIQSSELHIKYETQKKEAENNMLREKNEIQRRNNRKQMFLFSIILALTIVVIFVVYARYRAKQKANRELKEKNDKIEKQHAELEATYKLLKESEEELREANATKDKFFSIIAHDLKNPLHAITLSSDLLLHDFRKMDGDQLLELIDNINKSGQHISELLENLLQWSRSQTRRIEFNPGKTDLYPIIMDNFRLFRQTADQKGILLNNKVSIGTLAFSDINMINTVFRNLISNAIKFSEKGAMVTIDCETYENHLEVIVKDNGIGINDANLEKLFRIDVHLSTRGTNREVGTGLGLILSKEFIETNGGKISVESKEGVGSTFRFTLPLDKVQ